MNTAGSNIPDSQICSELQLATEGLLYPSESDEPFHVFVWTATEADAIRQIAANGKPITPVIETSVTDFFAELTATDDGDKYQHFHEVLESHLSGLRVLRIGEIEVDVWLIGKTPSGSWAGVQTRSIET